MNGLLSINGLQIYYEEHGVGEPLLLLHGNGEDCTVFTEQIAFFSPYFRVIAMDSRGHGYSSPLCGKLCYEDMADDVIKILEELNVEKCHIIGFSDGGILALLLALRVPKKIRSMIVIGANYKPSGLKGYIRIAIFAYYFAYIFRYLFSFLSPKWKWKKQLMKLMLFHPHITENALQSVENRTLVVVGDDDMIRFSHTKKLSKLLKNAHLLILKNCNHFVLEQQPALFNTAAIDFISKSLH